MLLSKASIHTLSASKSCFIKKPTQCRVLKGFTTFSLDFSPSPWKTVFPLLKKGKKQKNVFQVWPVRRTENTLVETLGGCLTSTPYGLALQGDACRWVDQYDQKGHN